MMAGSLRNPQWGNEAFALRYKQVDSLRQYFSSLKEITKDSLYEIAIVLPSRKSINLRIMLGPEFPFQAPTLQITPPVSHKFVNEQMYIMPQMHEKLATWTLHTNLGKTVYEITQKLIQDQPQILSTPAVNTSSTYSSSFSSASEPPPPYGSSSTTTRPPSTNMTTSNVGMGMGGNAGSPVVQSTPSPASPASGIQIRTPAIPTSFPELEQKTTAELTELLNNEDVFTSLYEGLEVVKTMRQLRDDLRDGNEDLAKKNIARTGEVDDLRKLLGSKKDTLAELRAALDQKTARQQQIMLMLSPTVLVERLADAAAAAESESDDIASAFLDGSGVEMDYKEFIKRFTEKRKLYHLRAAKKESTLVNLNMKRM